jgi:hypothetical protein
MLLDTLSILLPPPPSLLKVQEKQRRSSVDGGLNPSHPLQKRLLKVQEKQRRSSAYVGRNIIDILSIDDINKDGCHYMLCSKFSSDFLLGLRQCMLIYTGTCKCNAPALFA